MCRLHYDRQYAKSYREKNLERVRERRRTADKRRRLKDPEKYKALDRKQAKKWRENNPEKILENNRKYYDAHKQRIIENNRKWREQNPEKAKAQSSRKRARKAEVKTEKYDRNEVFQSDGFTCRLCEKSIDMSLKWPHAMSASIDHIIPISLGGDDIRVNVQSAHLGCNARKGNRVY